MSGIKFSDAKWNQIAELFIAVREISNDV